MRASINTLFTSQETFYHDSNYIHWRNDERQRLSNKPLRTHKKKEEKKKKLHRLTSCFVQEFECRICSKNILFEYVG